MQSHKEQFPVGAYVSLKGGIDPSLYNGFSRTGNTGWVRKTRFDQFGYPQVYIEWNSHDWAYNGTDDGWTWANHFEAVEENQMSDATQQNNSENVEENVRAITENFVKAILGALGSSVAPQAPEEAELEEDPKYWETLAAEAGEAIANSPAYMVIALEPVQHPNAPPMVIPRVFHAAKESEYALIVQSQLAHVLTSFQDATIHALLQGVAAQGEEDDERG